VVLDASNSVDSEGSIASYEWKQIYGLKVQLAAPLQARTKFNAPLVANGSACLIFKLTVEDRNGSISEDWCIVNVSSTNIPPKASAGADQTVAEGDTVTLDGSSSQDPDGTIVYYSWTQIDGPPVKLDNANSARTTFTAPHAGQLGSCLMFQLSVVDQAGLASDARSLVNITTSHNLPPHSHAGSNQKVEEGDLVTLEGSDCTDPEDAIFSYKWSQIYGPPVRLSDVDDVRTTFSAPVAKTSSSILVFQLTVTDGGNLKSQSFCTVRVPHVNLPPELSGTPTGSDKGRRGNLYRFSASATDLEGNLISYRFSWGDGSMSAWSSEPAARHAWKAPGTYCIKVQARDDKNAKSSWSECTFIGIE